MPFIESSKEAHDILAINALSNNLDAWCYDESALPSRRNWPKFDFVVVITGFLDQFMFTTSASANICHRI